MKNDNLEELVEELRAVTPLKSTTAVGDIVLIASENPKMLLYAVVTSIERDPTKKDDWWHIGLTFLTMPLQQVLWTLRTAQMTGREIFTMGGEKRFFQAVSIAVPDREAAGSEAAAGKARSKKSPLKRIK